MPTCHTHGVNSAPCSAVRWRLEPSAEHPCWPALARRRPPRPPAAPGPVLDIADWSYFWYGVEHATLARGTVINGCRCTSSTGFRRACGIRIRSSSSTEATGRAPTGSARPTAAAAGRRSFSSRATRSTSSIGPDRAATLIIRSFTDLSTPQAPTFEGVARRIGSLGRESHAVARRRRRRPIPAIAQVVASLGQPMANNPITQDVWRTRGAMLLDDIGPSVFVTHAMAPSSPG